MKIAKLMKCSPKVISPDATIAAAAKLMRKIDAGSLPVVENGKVVGMITDRDITVRATAHGKDPNEVHVCDVMTPQAVFCYADEKIEEAGKAMLDRKIGRLPVLSRENLSLAGIVSLADIIAKCGGKSLIKGGKKTFLAKSRYSVPALLAVAAFGVYASNNERWKFWKSNTLEASKIV